MSLCRKHMQRIEAALWQEQGSDYQGLDDYELMLVQLRDDVLRIKGAKSNDAKNAIKREIFPNYQAWIDGVLDHFASDNVEHSRQDDVFAQCFVWAVDLLDLPLVARMLSAMLTGKMTLPERFKRAPADFALEELADTVISSKQALSLEHLHVIDDLTAEIDLHDPVRAKWLKALGTLYESYDELEPLNVAISYFERALALDQKAGVRKRIDALQRQIKKLTEQPTE